MSLQPSGRLSREALLQIVLNATGGNVGLLSPIGLPGGQPRLDPLPRGLPNRGPLQDILSEVGARPQLRKAGEVAEKKSPGFHLAAAMDTTVQVFPNGGFVPGIQLPVQEFLDFLGGQMLHVIVHCQVLAILLGLPVHYGAKWREVSPTRLLSGAPRNSRIHVCQQGFQLPSGPMQIGFYRTQRQVHDVGDLFVGVPLDMPK